MFQAELYKKAFSSKHSVSNAGEQTVFGSTGINAKPDGINDGNKGGSKSWAASSSDSDESISSDDGSWSGNFVEMKDSTSSQESVIFSAFEPRKTRIPFSASLPGFHKSNSIHDFRRVY